MANKNQNKIQTLSPEEMKRFTLSITTPTGYARTTPAVISPPPKEEIEPSTPPPKEEIKPSTTPPTPTQQEKIAQIRREIEKVTAQLKEAQAKLEIIKEAERKGMAVSPKTTVEQAKQFLTEWRPPDINEVETITGELSAQKSSSNILTGSASIINLLSQQLADISQQLKEAREERKSFMEILKERIVSPFKREEFMRKAEEEAGLERLKALRETTLTQIISLRDQINKVQAERDAALAASEARLAPMAFIRGEQARIQERYQRELSRLNAQLGTQIALYQAQSGQIEEARRWINDIVEAATWDEQFRWQQLTTMATLHDRELSELGEEYRNWFSTLITLARLNYQEARESKRFVLQQMIENPEAGILPEDTPEEAAEKVATYKATLPEVKPEEMIDIDYWAREIQAGRTNLTTVLSLFPIAQRAQIERAIRARMEAIKEEIPPPPDYVKIFTQYRDKGWTREQVENTWIAQYNKGKPAGMQIKNRDEMNRRFPEIKASLDEVYGKEPSILERVKRWWSGIWK